MYPMKMYWMIALIGVSAGLAGCEYVLPVRPVLGYENNDDACSDERDNDEDGLVDCEDPDCVFSSAQCGEDVPLIPDLEPEAGLTCHDQIDNDDNGQFDCGDPACTDVLENCCSREFSNETCTDGIDNDGNGYTDCEDFGCKNDPFGFVTIDCQDVCVSTGESENTVDTCTDGIDNDCNGFDDCLDYSCSQHINAEISDLCPQENTLETCTDGLDNNSNGYVDCADRGCEDFLAEAIAAGCDLEDSVEECSDGIDNDGNGYADCSDFQCRRHNNVAVRRVCQESLPQTNVPNCDDDDPTDPDCYDAVLAACSDGQDNDGDSYVDCEDFDCSHHPLGVCQGTKVCEDN